MTALIRVCGKTVLEKVTVEQAQEKTENEKLQNGTQRNGEGINHSEIDALFDQLFPKAQ